MLNIKIMMIEKEILTHLTNPQTFSRFKPYNNARVDRNFSLLNILICYLALMFVLIETVSNTWIHVLNYHIRSMCNVNSCVCGVRAPYHMENKIALVNEGGAQCEKMSNNVFYNVLFQCSQSHTRMQIFI